MATGNAIVPGGACRAVSHGKTWCLLSFVHITSIFAWKSVLQFEEYIYAVPLH